ncbi:MULTISPECIES: hypothetical protein [unclassified Mesorhizobium]|uniref:hypothetical protein n=1 Tax=unclassified Mesorhizobium TaxID=325217 RepID=UPI0030149562
MIEQAKFTEAGDILAVIGGETVTVPNFPGNRHRDMLAAWEAEGNTIEPYAPPSPSIDPNDYPLSPYQFRAMLKIAGIEGTIIEAIDGIADPAARAVAQAKLDFALSYQRADPLFAVIAPIVGMTDAEIDALWLQAKDL